jgi:catalase
MLGHLTIIDDALASAVADKLGMPGEALTITPARAPVVLAASPALSMHAKRKSTIEGRTIAVLATDGSDGVLLARLRTVVEAEGANLVIVAPTIGGIRPQSGDKLAAQHALAAAPSVLFDAVVVAPSVSGAALLADDAAAIGWLREAFGHLKVIGFVEAARPWFERAGVPSDEGTIDVSTEGGISSFLAAAKRSRVWARETRVRS